MIKRYPNRKLYDTEAKQYITLEGIASLIRGGTDVQVVDHATGEDLTTLTLSQVILELERKRTGSFPRAVLAGLIQAGGETLGSLRRTLASPLDLARHVDDEIERRLQALVRGGGLAAAEATRLRTSLSVRVRGPSEPPVPDDRIERSLTSLGIPTREQFQRLVEQLDRLEARLDGFCQGAPAKESG